MRPNLLSGASAIALSAIGACAAVADEVPAFNVGTLTLHADVPLIPTYDVGTLSLHGDLAVIPTYDVGTLTLHGPGIAPVPSYNVGTLILRDARTERLRHP